MAKGHEKLRLAAKIGVFAAGLTLALCMPVVAFAANTATFSSAAPKAGSSTTAAKPSVSVIVYDKYGVKGSSSYSMTIDGKTVKPKLTYYSGSGYRKFKLSYAVPSTLSAAKHAVAVRVKDLKAKSSTYTWSFTVLDTTAPVTTSDAHLNYTGIAVIRLTANDNVSVAGTYYVLDGGPVTPYASAGITVQAAGAYEPLHSLEFWSVDARGNMESHHVVPFFVMKTFAMNHALPTLAADSSCVLSGCHGSVTSSTGAHLPSDLASIHRNLGCAPCHGGTTPTPLSNCQTCHPNHHGTDHVAVLSTTTDPSACTAAGCHGTNVTATHTKGCVECHGSTDATIVAAIAAGIADPANHAATCETCHVSYTAVHATVATQHAVTATDTPTSCVTTVCHALNSVMTIHSTQLTGGPAPKGCAACHKAGTTLPTTMTCVQAGCHKTYDAVHPALEATVSAHVTTNTCGSGDNASTCHPANVAAIHTTRPAGSNVAIPGCVACHATGKTPSTNCQATGCHVTSPHATVAAHASTENVACFGSTCHQTSDVSVIHANWINPPGCAACHAAGKTPSALCSPCHDNLKQNHDYQKTAHTSAMDPGCLSTGCHAAYSQAAGSVNLELQHANVPCVGCHASTDARVVAAIAGGHNECTACHDAPVHPTAHATLEANISGAKSSACTACHGTNILAVLPAGNSVTGVLEHKGCLCHKYGEATPANTECVDCHAGAHAPHGFASSTAAPAVSGHNTSQEGTVGAFTAFDGSQGVLVKDSAGATITAAWPLPNQNVFWALNDPSAPASAKTGLDYTSVVTCEDCHAGLTAYEVAGPHGSSVIANAGIDPNFSGGFESAFLWDGTDTHTVTVGGAPASGIGLYVPGGKTDEQKQELANWDVGNASLGTTGPATVSNGDSVICAKCHDLYNQGAGDIGWASYAHEHHADRPVSFGVWKMSDGTTVTADVRPTTGSIVATLAAPSLGREGAGACRDCHVAVPHGWKRPRLIVFSSDPAPYNIGPSVYEGESKTATSGVTIGSGQMNGLSSLYGPVSTLGGVNGSGSYNNWATKQCNACGHHAGTDLSGGAWK
jgi:hypothetical protein